MHRLIARVLLATLPAVLAPLTAAAGEDHYLGLLGTYVSPDSARGLDDGYGGRVLAGLPLGPATNMELTAHTYGDQPSAFGVGADLVFLLGRTGLQPFTLVGIGSLREDTGAAQFNSMFANAGVGLLWPLKERLFLRGDARYVHVFDGQGTSQDSLSDVQVNIGLQLALFAPAAPAMAAAPEPTAAAAAPAIPAAPAKAVDADRDGVMDGADQCPGTQPGTRVNSFGCALDQDGDKVADAQDSCPNTPAGVQVTVSGCPLDHDGDKVADYQDRCPNTLPSLKVDAAGCVVAEAKAQTVVLQNVNFSTGKAELTAEAKAVLDQIAIGLASQPSLKVEIGGHTDSVGAAAVNNKLSKVRAESVRTYLISKGASPGQLTAKGYGSSKPIADNKTKAGRAQNRRVEFSVLAK